MLVGNACIVGDNALQKNNEMPRATPTPPKNVGKASVLRAEISPHLRYTNRHLVTVGRNADMKKSLISFIIAALLAITATTTAQSNVDIFFVACDTQAVIDFRGTMGAGLDIYYQIFSNAGASGTALTSQKRLAVSEDYTVSQVAAYEGGATVAVGAFASLRVSIASESDPSRSIYETTIDDINDGCAEPAYATVDSQTTATAEATPNPFALPDGVRPIRAPGGGFIFPPAIAPGTTGEPIVVIGARPSEQIEVGRTNRPGLIFAECDQFPQANPGLIYDTDNITIFWSWFARTPAQVRDHIANARYSITLNGQPLPGVRVSDIETREGSINYWVFYTVDLGDKWKPGRYGISFKLEWERAINDGYDDYGPDTPNPLIASSCTFDILPNPYGVVVVHENPKIPLQAR